jgi:hypothetical protein
LVEAQSMRSALVGFVDRLDPRSVALTQAPGLWAELDGMERLVAGAKTLLARRVEESREWKRKGFRTAAEHLAAMGGTTVRTAQETLAVSAVVESLPQTEAAVRAGALSARQVTEVAVAAAADPSAEDRLLAHAQRSSLAELHQACLRTKANATADREVTYRRIHEQRRLRTWTDAEGAWNLLARGTPETGARILAALEPMIDARFTQARKTGVRERRDAYAFDALGDIADHATGDAALRPGTKRRSRPQHLALLRVDLEALTRGFTDGDEMCELTGLGPVPVSRARALLGDSTLRLVITKGVDVAHVTHLGRGPTAAQRIAVLWSSPTCVVEGCTRTRVEIDHRDDWAKVKRTELSNLDPLCIHHHDRKTRDRWALVPGTGKRPMVPPDDPRHPSNRRRARRASPKPHAA